MRHERTAAARFDTVDIAAAWPATAQIAPVPIPEVEPEPDAPWRTLGRFRRQRGDERVGHDGVTMMWGQLLVVAAFVLLWLATIVIAVTMLL